ncbi:MAG: hypothetical protein CMJ18_03635 [Phycisphaeraceae bacterium]|nr:hypothetical protein [Phycisphaeraceae bacterium]
MVLLASPTASGEIVPPFPYVHATAYHVLPQTNSYESGYFSLVDGLDGRMYIGTAFYERNAFLVQFDPRTRSQKIVIDTHALCGLEATGYAAQAKIHTRNFVGPSGKVYCGSMRGEKHEGDTTRYPGGYVMIYDPVAQRGEPLGMPMAGMGVIDVTADETRGLVYAVLKPDGHWMLRDGSTRTWRDLGPRALYYGQTIVDGRGRAHVITRDGFRLASYDPASDRVTTRAIEADESLQRQHIPNWRLDRDGRTTYLMGGRDDTTLWSLDLFATGDAIKARRIGRMLDASPSLCNSGMDVAPDGRVYAVIRADNGTEFTGRPHPKSHFPNKTWVHHLTRYDPKRGRIDDLGVLAIRNPDFVDFQSRPHCHGYQTFPDGTLAPKDHHFALKINRDGDIYITTIYPFALLRIRDER